MSLNNKWSRKRANLVNEQSDKLTAKIERAQNKLFKYITDTFLPSLETDANEALIPNDKMLFIPSMLDSYYDQFNEEELKPIVSTFASDITKLLKYNQKYYDGVKPSDEHGQIKESVLGALGISGAVIAGGSLLFNILTDRAAIAAIKTVVMAGIGTGLTITSLKIALKETIVSKSGGLIKSLFNERLPDPYVKVDRFIGKKYQVALKLNYAIYQGGTIGTSREFCIERNNKVFSREEIAKFGTSADKWDGYTDKSKGEFQGKSAIYDPFQDLGGYNCRHFYSWISDELAFTLRSELGDGRS
jgi:hypothetical protein